MHVVGESGRGSGRLSVYFEQDFFDEDLSRVESKIEHSDIRHIADDSFCEIAAVDSNNNNESIESSEYNESKEHNESNEHNNSVTPPPPAVKMRHKNNIGRQHSRSRERSFVHAASGAVVGGARTVARTFKRMSLIESSSSSSNIRERAAQESIVEDGVEQLLRASAKHKQQYNSTPSLPQSYSTAGAPLQPSGSAHSLGSPNPSPRSSQSHSQGKGSGSTAGKGGNTAKQHDQQASAVAAISSTSAAAGVGVAATSQGAAAAAATPPEKEKDKDKDKDKEKEKKRKEVSSSRVKKFHRHFSQASKDEKLINYFSCALVGDIPLQGHLYITEEHFAFYSNVFGYVTKVVIPTSSVTKISKEKTAKIIPNAVGVATADERHVFGSFISREAAFRLMCTVCTQLATGNEILPKPLPVDVELTEEYLIDDDSSCSISGNESPPHLRSAAAAAVAAAAAAAAAGGVSEPETMLRQRNISDRHSDLQGKSSLQVDSGMIVRSSAPPVVHYEDQTQALLGDSGSRQSATHSASTSVSSAGSSCGLTSSSSSPITVVGMGVAATATTTTTTPSPPTIGGKLGSMRSYLRLRLPTLTELHVLYLGIMLAIMLALFSVFLLYRILDIEAKTHLYNTPVDFNLRSGSDEDLFAEALRWQKELQEKSTAEAQDILSKNLEQISKVRRSLETLSMLIHDRRAGYAQPETEMEMKMDEELLPNVQMASSSSDFSD